MKVITAVEPYERQDGDVICFLAGGITGCKDWQNTVITELQRLPETITKHLVIMNPRRENFPIHDPNASQEQIEWEFKWLEECDIFSMYFTGTINNENHCPPSIQPICLYELGRNLVKHPSENCIISVEDRYVRTQDVVIQTRLATGRDDLVVTPTTPYMHSARILEAYKRLEK